METKSKIEVLEVSLDQAGLKTSRKVMSSLNLITWIGESASSGSTGVVHLRNLPDARVYLLLMADGNQGIFPLNGRSAAELTASLQVFSLMQNFERSASAHQDHHSSSNSDQQHDRTSNNHHRPTNGHNGEAMTEAQRRYLFRLMAEKKNLKGKDAENFIKQEFEVVSLHEIDKTSASRYIDRLVKGGGAS